LLYEHVNQARSSPAKEEQSAKLKLHTSYQFVGWLSLSNTTALFGRPPALASSPPWRAKRKAMRRSYWEVGVRGRASDGRMTTGGEEHEVIGDGGGGS